MRASASARWTIEKDTSKLVPQGYNHYIEQIGDQPTESLILFNGPDGQEIGLATWLEVTRALY